ncbi:MAG: serine/threonine-protein kinase [Acidobacteriota bacterium]
MRRSLIGETLGRYLIEEKLGQGGMGVVYRARDERLGRSVALKVLPPDLVRDAERRRRFEQEAKAASAVNHPAIAQIYSIEDEADTTFIVMEYVAGSTLRRLITRGELDLTSAVEIGIQVAEGLATAHRTGIVHRDIKSDNIMVTGDGHPKILDFGLAKLLASGDEPADPGTLHGSQAETLARTRAGVILGTVAYMSPEQARGLSVDWRSDIFSFGIVLYEMVTGMLPFEGASALDTMHAIAFDRTRPVTSIRSQIPHSLQRIVDRCLRKKPEERYQSLSETADELRAVRREIETGVSSSTPILERLREWTRGLSTREAVLAAAAGIAIVLVLLWMLPDRGMGGASPIAALVILGALLFRKFRNRGLREVRRFVKKAGALKEVRIITFQKGLFTIVADHPTARTYLKLNAYLSNANERLFYGEAMTMVVQEASATEQLQRVLHGPGVQYVRDDP